MQTSFILFYDFNNTADVFLPILMIYSMPAFNVLYSLPIFSFSGVYRACRKSCKSSLKTFKYFSGTKHFQVESKFLYDFSREVIRTKGKTIKLQII